MSGAFAPKIQTPMVLRAQAGTNPSAGHDHSAASAWSQAFEQAVRAGYSDADAGHEPRPLRTLAQPFANPPRWAPQREDPTGLRDQGDNGHSQRIKGVATAAARVDSSAGDAAAAPARNIPGSSNAAVPWPDPGALPLGGAASPARSDALAAPSPGREPWTSASAEAVRGQAHAANAPARRAFLSFVSQEELRDLPSDLPWQEFTAPVPDTGHTEARAASTSPREPLRLYAEWTGRGVNVWVGADQSIDGSELLPLLQRWIASRGERLVSFTCNGRREFEAAVGDLPSLSPPQPRAPDDPAFLSLAADSRPVTLTQENPWQPVP